LEDEHTAMEKELAAVQAEVREKANEITYLRSSLHYKAQASFLPLSFFCSLPS
jgi:hypothetical protein